eukprot:38420-Eustigmatos_ZCMA.PRE.1
MSYTSKRLRSLTTPPHKEGCDAQGPGRSERSMQHAYTHERYIRRHRRERGSPAAPAPALVAAA